MAYVVAQINKTGEKVLVLESEYDFKTRIKWHTVTHYPVPLSADRKFTDVPTMRVKNEEITVIKINGRKV